MPIPNSLYSKTLAFSGVGGYLEVGDNWVGGWQVPKGRSGVGFLGRGSTPSAHQLEGLGER